MLYEIAVRMWRHGNIAPSAPAVVVSLGYATCPGRLTDGTRESLLTAIGARIAYPSAFIAFANWFRGYDGMHSAESREKLRLLERAGVPHDRIIDAGPITNSVTEAQAIRDALARAACSPGEILLVADELHSRSALYIWRQVFPDARVSFVAIPSHWTSQPDHPILLQRGRWRWFIANVARHMALRVLGLSVVGKIVHPHSTAA